MREYDRDGNLTPFVKIGRVSSPKTSQERLLQHQTGNPRRLEIPDGHIVFTEAVSLVEAQLHRRFATDRIGGEWFKFSEPGKLEAALVTSKSLATEVSLAAPMLVEADSLEFQASNKNVIGATEYSLEQARILTAAKKQKKAIDAISAEIKELLSSAAKRGEDLGTAASIRNVTFKAKFDEATFLKENPDAAQKYFVDKSGWDHNFLLKYKLPKDFAFDVAFSNQLEEIRAFIPQGAAKVSAMELEEPNLRLNQLEALVDWDLTLSTAKLKIECGLNEGIDGVCTWKRVATHKSIFDSNQLYESDYELYAQYLLDETTKEYVIPTRGSKRK